MCARGVGGRPGRRERRRSKVRSAPPASLACGRQERHSVTEAPAAPRRFRDEVDEQPVPPESAVLERQHERAGVWVLRRRGARTRARGAGSPVHAAASVERVRTSAADARSLHAPDLVRTPLPPELHTRADAAARLVRRLARELRGELALHGRATARRLRCCNSVGHVAATLNERNCDEGAFHMARPQERGSCVGSGHVGRPARASGTRAGAHDRALAQRPLQMSLRRVACRCRPHSRSSRASAACALR